MHEVGANACSSIEGVVGANTYPPDRCGFWILMSSMGVLRRPLALSFPGSISDAPLCKAGHLVNQFSPKWLGERHSPPHIPLCRVVSSSFFQHTPRLTFQCLSAKPRWERLMRHMAPILAFGSLGWVLESTTVSGGCAGAGRGPAERWKGTHRRATGCASCGDIGHAWTQEPSSPLLLFSRGVKHIRAPLERWRGFLARPRNALHRSRPREAAAV